MAGEDDRVRLPELPVFKRYSLALRQEFAGGEEILAMLDRTALKVQQILDARRASLEEEQAEQASQVQAEEPSTKEVDTDPPVKTTETKRPPRTRRPPAKPRPQRRRGKQKPSIIIVPGGRARKTSAKGSAKATTRKTSAKGTSKRTKPKPSARRPVSRTGKRKR